MRLAANVDINENQLLVNYPHVLDIILIDQTTKNNIIWATSDYSMYGEGFNYGDFIDKTKITGKYYGIIKPRISKELEFQNSRVRDKAEVFTPSWICNIQNNLSDNYWFNDTKKRFNTEINKGWKTNYYKIKFPNVNSKSWSDYVKSTKLEISCGEAPYITSRYDVVSGRYITPKTRIGLLDRKLRVISENTDNPSSWLSWAKEAVKSCYGYDWQGDNIILARENVLFSVIEYYEYTFNQKIPIEDIEELAFIISWNFWQMDGLKGVIPNSCHDEVFTDYDLFGECEKTIIPCKGCDKENIHQHNGIYSLIKDWSEDKIVRFVDGLGE